MIPARGPQTSGFSNHWYVIFVENYITYNRPFWVQLSPVVFFIGFHRFVLDKFIVLFLFLGLGA